MASSSVSTAVQPSTGPKISLVYAGLAASRSARMVGPRKLPLGKSGTSTPRPSSTSVPPASTPAPIRLSARCSACGEMSGPRSAPSTCPAETLSFRARSASSGIHSLVSATKIAWLSAMQRWPAAPKAAPTMALSVASLSASGRIVTWFFAPRLACTFLLWRVPRSKTWRPAASPPTKDTVLMRSSVQRKSTVSCVPCTTLSTPSGRPASLASSESSMAAPGSRSDGFITTVLPVAAATGKIQSGIMAGKLKGQMPAVTPSGCR
mmetsp:Transcript_41008/g.128583  ORF Transcript_41008/g.128583 Transcript_41008/m.128583 type:complete len:264 (+) Transcript_41008:658-1449(+)